MALVILLIILVFPIDYSDGGDEDQWQRGARGVVRNRIFTMMMR